MAEGLVLAHLGQGLAVEHDGEIVLCQPLRKLDTVAVGDMVSWSLTAPGQGRIEAILPRRSLLARPGRNQKTRPVAANIDTLYVVIAAQPACDFLLVDQYLAVCEHNGIDVALILNKIDLPIPEEIEQELLIYQILGYKIIRISAKTGAGLDHFRDVLNGKTSLLAGQSGIGKSSITNALAPDAKLRTNAISATTKHGRHTTTAATLFHIPTGGDLIDSPGVAIFGLADLDIRLLAQGYREFQPLVQACKFNDCRHLTDQGCAVRLAAEKGEITSARYQRYVKLISKMQ
jgi:ribosome biogenesis GTPase